MRRRYQQPDKKPVVVALPKGSTMRSSREPMQFHGAMRYHPRSGGLPVDVYRQKFLVVTGPGGEHVTDIVGEWRVCCN